METTPQGPAETLRPPMGTEAMPPRAGTPGEPMNTGIHPGPETMDMKDKAMQMAQGAMDMGSKAIHAVSDKISEKPSSPESSRSKGRMIAIGSMTAAGIGMVVKRRQNNKTRTQNIAGRAKDLIHSR